MSHPLPGVPGHVFLSYGRADGLEQARQLEMVLRLEGFATWRDTRDLALSADFTSEIENAIRNSLAVVVCVTHGITNADSFVRREIAYAQMEKRPIVLARFADVPPPVSVITNTCVDFHVSSETARSQLLNFLRAASGGNLGSLPGIVRNAYLAALYHEISDYLDDVNLLPVLGRRMKLMEVTGLVSRTNLDSLAPAVISARYFQPTHDPIAGAGIRQALDYARQRLAIVGAAGSGKTVALMALARELASEAITDPGKPVPLMVSAAAWGTERTGEAGLVAWLAHEIPMLAGMIPGLISSRQALLLVDGIDELPELTTRLVKDGLYNPRADLLNSLPKSGPLVIASRLQEFREAAENLNITRIFEIQPLTESQVAEFVVKIPAVAALLEQDNELRAASRTPLMLTLLCSAVDAAGRKQIGHLTPPEARDLIIGSYIESRYEKESAHQLPAGRMPLSLDEIYLRLGSLAMNDAGGGGNRNLFAVSNVKIHIDHDDTYSLLLDMNIMVPAGGRSLRFYHLELRDHFAFRYAVRAMKDSDAVVRNRAAWALWQIPDRRALGILLESLSDPDPFTRGGVVSALGRIGDPRAAQPLTALLSDEALVASIYGRTIADVARWAIDQVNRQK